ncbi:MAG: right-handed parallel beta-helix repeat-containing protein, partial [bacterium]
MMPKNNDFLKNHIVSKGTWFLLSLVAFLIAIPSSVSAACGTVATVPSPYPTIQAAVNVATGTTLTGDHCITINNGTYTEQVTIEKINTTANYRIIISSAPGAGVTVSPPASSIAAFVVKNASVTISGINVSAINSMSYGIRVSSPNVTVSSVNVNGYGYINAAGIFLSNWSYLSYSSVTVQAANAYGIQLVNSTMTTVSDCTTQTNNNKAALYLTQASSNTITRSLMYSSAGYGAQILNNSRYNTIIQSTMSANSTSMALNIDNSSANIITQSYISNPAGYAAFIGFNADNNYISQSTITSNAAAYFAVKLQDVSSTTITQSYISNPAGVALTIVFSTGNIVSQSTITNNTWAYNAVFIDISSTDTITGSYVRGPNAVFVRDSIGTSVLSSVLVATNTYGEGLRIDTSRNVVVSTNTISGGSQGRGISLSGNSGTLSFSSNTVSGSNTGLGIAAQQAGTNIQISTMTFTALSSASKCIDFTAAGTLVSTFAYVNFADNNININVDGNFLSAGSQITMLGAYGPKAGSTYEYDPNKYVDWGVESSLPPQSFETGIIPNFFATGGDASWSAIYAPSAFDGTYAAKAGAITHSQSTYLQLDLVTSSTDQITFARKTSSEMNYDYLKFFVDGAEKGKWSGETGWEKFSYLLLTGAHTLKWEYSKDSIVSSGQDTVWIDSITVSAVSGAGMVSVSTANMAPADQNYDVRYPALRLDLVTDGNPAIISSMTFVISGSVSMSDLGMVELYRDSNGNGVFDPGTDADMGYVYPTSAAVTIPFPEQVLSSVPSVFFVTLYAYQNAVGKDVRISISTSGAFGLDFGTMASQGIYPVVSALTQIKRVVPAFPPVIPSSYTPSGGYNTNIWLNAGKTYDITASGTWDVGTGSVGPAGSGACATCVLPSAQRGALIGHEGMNGAWFLVGASTNYVSITGDYLYLAANDDYYYDNYGFLDFSVTPQTVSKKWTGGSCATCYEATNPANWENNTVPAYGDNVVFDGVITSSANKRCNWNIYWISISSLTLEADFTGEVIISPSGGNNNKLIVNGPVDIQGGTLGLDYNQQLQAATITVAGIGTSAGVMDLGSGSSYLYIGEGGLTITSSGTLKSEGNSSVYLYPASTGYFPVQVLGGTVSVTNTSGLYLSGSSGVDVFPGVSITAFDYVMVSSLKPGTTALILYGDPGQLTFKNWDFDSSVSTNVSSVFMFGTSSATMLNATGQSMGTINEADPGDRIIWDPDGGGAGDISGTITYSGPVTGNVVVQVSTMAGIYPIVTSSFSLGAYSFSSLNAPATYYFSAFRDFDANWYADNDSGNYEPRVSSGPVYLDGTGSISNYDLHLADVGVASGSITNNGAQSGSIILSASDTGVEKARKSLYEFSSWYELALASGTYDLLAYVDANANGLLDSAFESSGTVSGVIVTTGQYVTADLSLSTGAAEAGGTVFISTMGYPGYAGTAESPAFLKLGLWSDGGTSKFRSLKVKPVNMSSGTWVAVYRDSDLNGIYDSAYDTWLGNGYFTASSTVPVLVSFSGDEIL